MRPPVLAGVVFLLVFIGVLVYETAHLLRGRHRVEVCMQFAGHTNCAIGSNASRDSALRSATTSACAIIASGITDSQQCEHSTPVSVKWLEEK